MDVSISSITRNHPQSESKKFVMSEQSILTLISLKIPLQFPNYLGKESEMKRLERRENNNIFFYQTTNYRFLGIGIPCRCGWRWINYYCYGDFMFHLFLCECRCYTNIYGLQFLHTGFMLMLNCFYSKIC